MQNHRDYRTYLGVGIRLRAETCQVIRKVRGVWQEFGPVYELPVDRRLMDWRLPDIPPGVLAVALRAFEPEFRGTRLRSLLTTSDAPRRRMIANGTLRDQRSETAA